MLDDVSDLLCVQPKVDRHEHASVRGNAEERGQQTRGVVRDDGNALTRRDAERVEPGGLGAREACHLGPRELAE